LAPRDGILLLASFLCGSIPFGLLLARAKGINIRAIGSGNIGATNVGRALGQKFFILCLLLDALKGLIPVLVAGWVLGGLGDWTPPVQVSWLWLGCAACAVLGHVFCPWLKFKGGKGVATSLGAFLGVFPVMTAAVLGAAAIFFIALRTTRYMSLASIAAAAGLPVCVMGVHILGYVHRIRESRLPFDPSECVHAIFGTGRPFVVVAAAMGLLVIWAHRANLRRLKAGTEPRFGAIRPS